jgi:predicted regulator of Ras-like GTPase activity (Roadblock/LC7/MglB family)
MAKTASNADLAFLLNDLVSRVAEAQSAVVLSNDGLLMACSRDLARDDAEHLAALASGIQSLARGAGIRFGGGPPRQAIIEMDTSFLFITGAGQGAGLAVLAAEHADVGLIAYEMAMLVKRAGKYLTTPSRATSEN